MTSFQTSTLMAMLTRLYHSLASWKMAVFFSVLAGGLSAALIYSLRARPPTAPSILALQLAFSSDRLASILDQWGKAAMEAYVNSMWLDFLYPPAYAAAFSAWFAFLMRNQKEDVLPMRHHLVLFVMPFVAAGMDYVENALHLWMFAILHALPPLVVFLASLAAAIKWSLIGISIVVIGSLAIRFLMSKR